MNKQYWLSFKLKGTVLDSYGEWVSYEDTCWEIMSVKHEAFEDALSELQDYVMIKGSSNKVTIEKVIVLNVSLI